jgi:hypothetical protein
MRNRPLAFCIIMPTVIWSVNMRARPSILRNTPSIYKGLMIDDYSEKNGFFCFRQHGYHG